MIKPLFAYGFALATALCLPSAPLPAQVLREITLREAIRLAARQSPEWRLGQLEIEQADRDAALVRAERTPQLFAGSGLGYTDGIPQSIAGAAPSIAQVTAMQPLFDAGRKQRIRQARQLSVAAAHSAEAKRANAVHRAGALYLDMELAARSIELLERQLDHFRRIEDATAARVEEGREIPAALTRARLDGARAAERLRAAQAQFDLLEADLRRRLDLEPDVRLRPVADDSLQPVDLPGDRAEAQRRAVENHPDIAALEARLRAKDFQRKTAARGRYPKLDLVAQYALLAKFNNYDEFFNRFQSHNWQAGISFQAPLFAGKGVAERVAKARLEARSLEIQRKVRQADIELESLRAYENVREAESRTKLARLELDYARENLGVLLAQFEEGRLAVDPVERARVIESAAWRRLYESRYAFAKAKLALLHATGDLIEAFAD